MENTITDLPSRLYFAYGSNLHLAQMMRRCPTAVPVRTLSLNHWRLIFRDVLDVVPQKGHVVHGALYRVFPQDIAALDRYEGVKGGLYRQVEFEITETGERAFLYRMNDNSEVHPPSQYYLDVCAQGFRDWNLPIEALAISLRHAEDSRERLYDRAFQKAERDGLRRPRRQKAKAAIGYPAPV